MSLILAIESDHRQSQHLTRIARRLGAEVILAESFERALPAIGDRVPDVILVPALLSPQDDSALKFVLRMIAGTRHVQVVTTPQFAGSSTAPASRAVLSRLLGGKDAEAAGGCDPDEFARHVASYLEAAAVAKRSASAAAPPPLAPPFEAALAEEAELSAETIELPPETEPAAEIESSTEIEQYSLDALIARLRSA